MLVLKFIHVVNSVSLLDGTFAFDSRIWHQKGATCARGGVLTITVVVGSDTTLHAVHSCTVALQYTVLIKRSICSYPH